ncbi:hypothetical protein ADIMK_2638 [Marinobacterium lacunae]|uniref:SnoaL-like domain-containing protein n=1 Tax=Marinobacterium lacunae TaxID=1232683 RepID=A0A081FX59_9GAMM|nr:nuclear transport factor 2 family protein [Marinobacterium lacunae]KEA63114.1 hypothetical protein ADIMK_2638 [Marinobacterium lacunae]
MTEQEKNKELVRQFYRQVFDGQNAEIVPEFVAESYVQHCDHIPPGREGLQAFVRMIFPDGPVKAPDEMRNPPLFMVAENDMVVVCGYLPQPDPERPGETYDYYLFDAFRVQNGKLAEHWSGVNKIALPK